MSFEQFKWRFQLPSAIKCLIHLYLLNLAMPKPRTPCIIRFQVELAKKMKAAEGNGCPLQPSLGILTKLGMTKYLFIWLTGLQVKLAEVLGGAEGDHHHAVPEDVLPCGHLESDLCAGDETVLLDHRVNRLHPAVPEVYPGERDERRNIRSEIYNSVPDVCPVHIL